MPVIIPDPVPKPPLWTRLAWFVVLYGAGVASVGLVAYGLRFWIKQ